MPTNVGPSSNEQSQGDSTSDSSMVAPTINGARYREKHASTPPPISESRYREKGKQRPTHLNTLSIESASSTPPTAEHDVQTNSYFLPVPSSNSSSNDVTPTATSMKSPPRPPARSPLRQNQQLGSPRRKTVELTPTSSEPTQHDFSLPIPRQGKDNSDAARARRREAYKSGVSFISLYELYSDPPPPVPVPPLPALDRTKFASETGSIRRARSGSTNSVGGSREGKGSSHGSSTPAGAKSLHSRDRSGSTSGSQPKASTSAPGGALDSPNPRGLANATMSSSVTPMSSNPSNLGDASPATAPIKTKRQHVLFELLETERIYSSDMALVKAVHLPLALGLKIDFGPMGSTISARSSTEHPAEIVPSRSSGVSTNTVSSTPSQSGSSGPAVPYGVTNEIPMSVEDAKVIFANLDELAEFAGRFTEFIQLALGAEIDGGDGPDKVGELFLQMLPVMAPLYETYITKHSASIARLTALTTENPTPAMMRYIEQTKAIASTHSNSWDLNSLLIKPIQRFLKYPLLLETLVMSTPDTHPDKPALLQAKDAMVEASRTVNEQTQKVEICRTILQRKPLRGLSAVFASNTPNSSQLKVKGSKSVFAVTKSKDGGTNPAVTPSPSATPFDAAFDPIQLENRISENASGGAAGLEELIKHLQGFESILPLYMRDVVNWVRSVRDTLTRLEKWSAAFEKVIALDDSPGIEALDAFRGVLTERLSPMLDGLETAVRTTLAPTLTKIQDTMKGPTLLLNTAASLRTVHNQLMNNPYTGKNSRPSPQVIEGSKTYLALMQQLRTDLPVYVRHLDKMFGVVVLHVAKWQERWYREVGNAWGDLWKALEVGPGNRKEYRARRAKELANKGKQGKKADAQPSEDPRRGAYGCSGDETVAIWWDRWEEVNGTIAALGVPSGAALQGVRSLQGLIKSPLSAFIAGVNTPLPAPSPPRNIPFEGYAIEESMEFAVPKDDDYHPPGYFPSMPARSRSATRTPAQNQPSTISPRPPAQTQPSTSSTRPPAQPQPSSSSNRPSIQTHSSSSSNRPSIQTQSQTSFASTATLNSRGQATPSPTQAHPINNFLPAVSPGPVKKEKPALKTKTVSFPPHATAPASPVVENESPPSNIYSSKSAANSRDWTWRARTQSEDRVPRHKKSDPAPLSNNRPPLRRGESPIPPFDPEVNINGSRTVPRGSSFRKRLSENMWFGDSSSSATKTKGGLDIDGEELEAAVATTHAREEREAELADIGHRIRSVPNGNVSLQRRPSNASSTRDVLHKRRTSDANDSTITGTRRHTGSVPAGTRRQRPSVDLNRQVVSEYGRVTGGKGSSKNERILFTCSAVAAFQPQNLKYRSLPFLTLDVGDIVNITQDAGRPSQHPDLEAVVSDGVDTLFIGTKLPDTSDGVPEVGWLWASFVMPFET